MGAAGKVTSAQFGEDLYAGHLAHSRHAKSCCCCYNDVWKTHRVEEEEAFISPSAQEVGYVVGFPHGALNKSLGLGLPSTGSRRELEN